MTFNSDLTYGAVTPIVKVRVEDGWVGDFLKRRFAARDSKTKGTPSVYWSGINCYDFCVTMGPLIRGRLSEAFALVVEFYEVEDEYAKTLICHEFFTKFSTTKPTRCQRMVADIMGSYQ